MKTSHEKYNDALIISRLQQIEIASRKASLTVDSPFFPLLTTTKLHPFFDNLPLHLGMEFRLIGSKIVALHITRGYFCHDLEDHLSMISPLEGLIAIARLDLRSPIFYQAALYTAFKRLSNEAFLPAHVQFFTVAMEFARVAHNLLVIKNVLFCLRLSSLAEIVMDCEEIVRAPCQLLNRLRTHADPIASPLSLNELSDLLADAYARAEELASAIALEETIRSALQKKAVVSMTQAGSMGLTGAYLRANQDRYDLRQRNIFSLPYAKAPRISVAESQDAWARFSLRAMDILASLKWLKQTLSQSEQSQLEALIIDDAFCRANRNRALACGEVEGPEGDIKVSIFSKNDGTLLYRIRTPAYFIAQAIPHLLTNLDLKDVATLLFSLGITAEEVDK